MAMMMPGAMPSAITSAVVEGFAPNAMLAATPIPTAETQAPMSHDDLNDVFTMISTLLWIGRDTS